MLRPTDVRHQRLIRSTSKQNTFSVQSILKVYPKVYLTFPLCILKTFPWHLQGVSWKIHKVSHFQTWRQLKIFDRNARAGFTKFEPFRPVGPQLIFALLKRMIPVHHFFSKSTMQFRLYACKQMAWEHKEMDSLMQQL